MKTYSTRSNAVRAAKAQNVDFDAVEFVEGEDGRWTWEEALTPVEARALQETGYATCPACKVSLENGYIHFEDLVDQLEGNMNKALLQQQHDWGCLGCGHEWGAAVAPRKEDVTQSKRKYNRTGSNADAPSEVESPVSFVHRLYSDLYESGKVSEEDRRKQMIAEAIGAGINRNTAAAQYNSWRKARGL